MVAFYAVIVRGQCNLLPSNHRHTTLKNVLASYQDSYLLHDGQAVSDIDAQCINIRELTDAGSTVNAVPDIDADKDAAIVFTSGSTGASSKIRKSWYTLVAGAEINKAALGLYGELNLNCVSTVPPWHMYGLEWSVLLPTRCNVTVYAGNSFYPADICSTLSTAAEPRWLITTPLQLRAINRCNIKPPKASLIMSATSPLDLVDAKDAESLFRGRLLEIYGCSEVGSLATRRPTENPYWKFLTGFSITRKNDSTFVTVNHVEGETELGDILEFTDDGSFQITGRKQELVKIGGKRESMQNITGILLKIDGVEDAVVFVRPPKTLEKIEQPTRLAAFVVSQSISIASLKAQLADAIEPVFMPRPLMLVKQLPREASGKLPREQLIKMFREYQESGQDE
jgi:acyl-coenzyme A synthetase/AMP-(fatty) acid ligase